MEECNIRIGAALNSRLAELAAEAEVSVDQLARSLLVEHLGNADPRVSSEHEIMNASEAAEFLGLDRKSVYEQVQARKIPHNRVGRRILFSRGALVEWVGESYER